MSDRPHEFLARGYDVAFHTKQVRDSGLMIKKVADLEFLVCASPGYLDRAGVPRTSADLADHDCLVHSNYPIWQLREDGRDVHLKIARTAYVSNSYLTLQKAAVAGRGVTMLPVGPALGELRSEHLVPVLDAVEVPHRSLYVIYAPGKYTLTRVRVFLDFIADWFRKHPIEHRDELPAAASG